MKLTFLKDVKIRIVLALLVLGVVGYSLVRGQQTSNIQKTDSVKVQRGTLEDKLTVSGKIDAEEHVTLRFQTSGKLAWVGVKEGDKVQKYQGIAGLDQRELKKKLEKYLNTYSSERRDFDQTTQDDYKDTALTNMIKRVLEKAQFDLNNSVLDVEIQDLTVQLANLWTPIEGIVTKVNSPYAGVNITPSQAEFEVVNPKTVYFSATADQTEVTKLSESMTGELILDSYLDDRIKGKIKNISFTPKSGETGTVYEIKFVFENDNSGYKYKLGMTGDLDFILKRKENALHLPVKFVKGGASGRYVYILKNGERTKVEVKTGMETEDTIEIVSGVGEEETVYE